MLIKMRVDAFVRAYPIEILSPRTHVSDMPWQSYYNDCGCEYSEHCTTGNYPHEHKGCPFPQCIHEMRLSKERNEMLKQYHAKKVEAKKGLSNASYRIIMRGK